MVKVVVISTGPEGEYVLEGPRKIVSAVSIDGLEETENDPDVHGKDVEVSGAKDVNNRTSDRSCAENKDLGRMSVLGSKTEGGRVFVVNFVDVFVHGTPVKELMGCRTHESKPIATGGKKDGFAYRRSETCPRKRRKMRPEGRFPSR